MVIKNNDCPVIFALTYIGDSSTTFYLADKEIKLSAPKAFMNELIKTCDGEKTTSQIIEILSKKWQRTLVKEILAQLKHKGILCNSTSISSNIWPFVKNPTRFMNNLSEKKIKTLVQKAFKRHKYGRRGIVVTVESFGFQRLLNQRQSTRFFSQEMVDTQTIAQLLWSGYGTVKNQLAVNGHYISRHTVPSAGALYPLRLSVGIFKPSDKLKTGIYDIYLGKADKIGFVLKKNTVIELQRSFADPLGFKDAQGAIVISGSFKVTEEKYGNRALLYVLLEAGHVVQNIHLAAVEKNIGTVEVGGFQEDPLRDALELPADYWPLSIVVFGRATKKKSKNQRQKSDYEIRWTPQTIDNYQLPFSMAFVRLTNQKTEGWACGRAKDPIDALSKASSEAEEWAACSFVPDNLVLTSLKELRNPVDPCKIVKYHPLQYLRKSFSLKPFNHDAKYLWKEGWEVITGNEVFILSDCIYFPYTPPTPRYTYANSSGTAAHFIWDEAVKHATLELVERDAFMITWANRLPMPQISFRSLPEDIQKRIRILQGLGFKVVVKDFTFDLVPVVFVFAQNVELPITTCASCSSFDITKAIDHALMEVEAAVYCRMSNGPSKPIQPRMVRYTDDHGSLYEQRKFYHKANFLTWGKEIKKFSDVGKNTSKNWEDLMDRFRIKKFSLIAVDLSSRNKRIRKKPYIVKVFVPGIIPMSFGYGNEPYGMERIYDLPIHMGYQVKHLPYKELTKFPHPYT